MRKQVSILAVIATLLLPTGKTFAQSDTLKNQISLGLEFLTHGEICGGGLPRAAKSTENRSAFLFGRARLKVDYKRKGLHTHAVLQNSAVWGMSGNMNLGLYEGWVKMNSRHGLFAQAGRVALAYDDERIIGTNDFATAAKSHDVLLAGYEGHGHKVHAILAFNQNGNNVYYGTYYDGGSQFYKTMQTLWYHYDFTKLPLGASLLFMNIGMQAGVEGDNNNPARVEYQQVYGGYVDFHPKYVRLEGSFYRQTGRLVGQEKTSKPVKAWMASVKAAVNPTSLYGFLLGYDYLSGDDYVPVIYGGQFGMPYHDVERGFTPLYGSRTQFYGIMDYFYESAYINGFTPGLQNAFMGVSGKPFAGFSCGVTYHYLAVATRLDDLKRTLGHSIELEAGYQFSKDIKLLAGYTQMIGTETMARLKQEGSSNRAHWGWFSLVISPSLFSAKW